MKIKIERSGGFAGISKTIMIDTDNLPNSIPKYFEKHMSERKPPELASNTMKGMMADCYFYKISRRMGKRNQKIEISEFDLDKEFRKIDNDIFKKHK